MEKEINRKYIGDGTSLRNMNHNPYVYFFFVVGMEVVWELDLCTSKWHFIVFLLTCNIHDIPTSHPTNLNESSFHFLPKRFLSITKLTLDFLNSSTSFHPSVCRVVSYLTHISMSPLPVIIPKLKRFIQSTDFVSHVTPFHVLLSDLFVGPRVYFPDLTRSWSRKKGVEIPFTTS